MSLPHTLSKRLLPLVGALLLVTLAQTAVASATTGFGELRRFAEKGTGEAGKGTLAPFKSKNEEERQYRLGVDPTDNSVYVLDEPKAPSTKHKLVELHGEKVEVSETVRTFRIQKFDAEGKFLASTPTISVTSPETEEEETTEKEIFEGLAVDPAAKRVYLLLDEPRKAGLAKDVEASVATKLYAFATTPVGGEIVGASGTTEGVLAGPAQLASESEEAGKPLIEATGLTVDPNTGELIVVAHTDSAGVAVDNRESSSDHFVLQRISATGALGERYVDTKNFFKNPALSGALPNSPAVAKTSDRVLVSYNGVAQVPSEFQKATSEEKAPTALFSERHERDEIEVGEQNEHGGALSLSSDGTTIYRDAAILNQEFSTTKGLGEGVLEWGISLRNNDEHGSAIGWTGGQSPLESSTTKNEDCVIEPGVTEVPFAVAAGKEGTVFALDPEYLMPGEESFKPLVRDAVIEFGPGGGGGCPKARALPLALTVNGEQIPEETVVKTGKRVVLSTQIEQADSLSIEWEIKDLKTGETTKLSSTSDEFEEATLNHAFIEEAEYQVTAKVHTDDLATPEVISKTRKVIVQGSFAAKEPEITKQPPAKVEVEAGAPASFSAEATGAPVPTVQWQVSTDGGKTFTNDTADGGATTDTLTIAETTAAESNNRYRAVFVNESGEKKSEASTLVVHTKAPVVKTSPANKEAPVGEAVTFVAEAEGAPAPTAQWEVSTDGGKTFAHDTADSASKIGASKYILTISSPKSTQNGNQYRVTFSNGVGSPATSSAATLTVLAEAPHVKVSPESKTVSAPASASFTAEAGGLPKPAVQWQVSTDGGKTFVDDMTDLGSSSGTLTIVKTSKALSGNRYRAVFKNELGEATSGEATLTVNTAAPAVSKQPAGVTVLAGQSASFGAAATGIPAPTVQWQVSTNGGATFANDTSDPGNTTGTLTIASAVLGQNGYEYRAIFTNEAGQAVSGAAVLAVTTPVVQPPPPEEKHGTLPFTEGTPKVTIAGASLSVTPAGAMTLHVGCAPGPKSCSGTITLKTLSAVSASAGARAGKSKKTILTLASGSFSVAGGKVATVTLHLAPKARKLLSRLHVVRARATIVAHNPSHETATTQSVVTLKPAAKGHKH